MRLQNQHLSYINFSLGDLNTVLLEANEELLGLDLAVTIVGVEGSEGSAEAAHGCGTSLVELGSHSVQDYAWKC